MPDLHREQDRKVFLTLLRRIRREQGLRQIDVAEALEVPQSFVSKYESGERRLDLLELRRLCSALGLSLPELVERLEQAIGSGLGGAASEDDIETQPGT